LPDFLIADLYRNVLVEVDDRLPETATSSGTLSAKSGTRDSSIIYTGENGKKVIIVIGQNAAADTDADINFLTNILKACQLYLPDIAIVDISNQGVTFSELKEKLNAVQILLFGVDPSVIKLPFVIPAFQVQNFAGCTIMFAPALSQLNKTTEEGRLMKTKLWNSLKQVFGIK
ncbi:MAG TPA: hypothetical protein VF610_04775, partial [Segetibacter sp.]